MNCKKLYIVNLIFHVIPPTSLFAIKRFLLKWAGAKIGKNVRICSSAKIIGNGYLEVGDNTWIGHEVLIIVSDNIKIGANVDIAPRVYLGNGSHKVDSIGQHSAGLGYSKPIIIENGVWLCIGSIILPGITVGYKAIVSAGCIVNKNVNPFDMVGGVPCKLIKNIKE